MPSAIFDLTGRVAIITGSSRGIGFASALRMAELGAKVVVSGRKIEACEEAAHAINREAGARGGEAIPAAANIGRREDLEALVSTAIAKWGKVDIVMANAAIHPWIGSIVDLPEQTFQKFIQANVQSGITLAQLTLPGMAGRGYGRFLIVASIVGLLADAETGTYGLTKAADMQMARNIALEFGAKGVTANCIAPGTIRTEMARSQWDNEQTAAAYTRRNPTGRFGEADEVAGLAVMLASRAGGYINGQTIVVDGGHSISFR